MRDSVDNKQGWILGFEMALGFEVVLRIQKRKLCAMPILVSLLPALEPSLGSQSADSKGLEKRRFSNESSQASMKSALPS